MRIRVGFVEKGENKLAIFGAPKRVHEKIASAAGMIEAVQGLQVMRETIIVRHSPEIDQKVLRLQVATVIAKALPDANVKPRVRELRRPSHKPSLITH